MKHTYTNLWFNSSTGDTREGEEGRRAMSCCRRRLCTLPSVWPNEQDFWILSGSPKGYNKAPVTSTDYWTDAFKEGRVFNKTSKFEEKKSKFLNFLQKTLIFQISEFKLKFCAGHPPSNHVPLLGFLIAAPHSIGVTPPLTGQILGPPLVSRYTM